MTENQRALVDMQISKMADLSSDYKFKRRSIEEQFKINKKVLGKLDDCERNLGCSKLDKGKENLTEGKTLGISSEFSFKMTRYNITLLRCTKAKNIKEQVMVFFTHKKASITTTKNHLLTGIYLHIKRCSPTS